MPAHSQVSKGKNTPIRPYLPDPRDDSDPLAPPKELREVSYIHTSETFERRRDGMAVLRARLAALQEKHARDSIPRSTLTDRKTDGTGSKTVPKFERTGDDFLIVFLRAKKFNADAAFLEYVNFCRAHTENSWLKDVDIGILEKLISTGSFQILPKTDRKGRMIMSMDIKVLMPYAESLGKERMQDFLAAVFGMLETLMLDVRSQIFGLVIVADLTNCKLKTFGFLSVQQYLLSLELCQHCYPLRASGMYIIHEPWYVRGLFNVMRPFMKPKTKDNLLCFGTSVKQIHRFIPKESLVATYGGTLRYDDEAHTKFWIDAVKSRHG